MFRLNLTGGCYTGGKATFTCEGLAKQTRPNNDQSLHPVEIKAFEDKRLCPHHKKLSVHTTPNGVLNDTVEG